MITVYIKPTEKCNLKCQHCFNINNQNEIDYEKLYLFLANINKLYGNGYFILHGGEPLLNNKDKLIDLIKAFPDNKWGMTSNLTLDLSDKDEALVSLLDEMSTSFDLKMRFTNIKMLLKWYRNVKRITKINKDITINFCATKYLININPAKILKLVSDLGIEKYNIETYIPGDEVLNVAYSELDDWLCELYKQNKQYPKITNTNFTEMKYLLSNDVPSCHTISCCRSTITINSDNTIGNCAADAHSNLIGTLDDKADTIIKKVASIKRKIKNECLQCEWYNNCYGECRVHSWQDNRCSFPIKLASIMRKDFDQ